MTRVDVAPGAVWLKQYLSDEEQRAIARQALALLEGPAGGYVPTVRGGGKMRVRMLCLGRHWNPLTYRYEATRADHDGAPVAPIPDAWIRTASAAAAESGFDMRPDICIVNWYGDEGRMGLLKD
jgi:alkylated DNA repair protein (DNA oxidative demethylase)